MEIWILHFRPKPHDNVIEYAWEHMVYTSELKMLKQILRFQKYNREYAYTQTTIDDKFLNNKILYNEKKDLYNHLKDINQAPF